MAPKNKGKKGKKQDDDDFWENAGTSIAGNNVASPVDAGDASDDDIALKAKAKPSFSAFAALGLDEAPADEEEDQDFGGLMSVIKASTQKSKKEKKDKKKDKKKGGAAEEDASVSFADGPAPGEGSDGEAAAAKGDISAPQKPVQVTAEELADEEWGPVKEKGKKGKKGKKKGKAQDEDEDEKPADTPPLARSEASPSPAPESKPEDGADGAEEGGVKILSKKEKEKLKKEREKAKKKAQAAAKKATQGEEAAPSPTDSAPPQPDLSAPGPAEGEEEEEGEGGAGGGDKKKKKKKKAKKDEEPAPAPAPAGKKKASGISALKALMEEKKRLEEEARKREEEERRRIEEEERRAAEEERKREEEKQRRKEKEKAKREQLKKEGRLLTKKQKEEQRMAELRKQALLASGVQIEALQGGAEQRPKKPVYDNRKKKKGPASVVSAASGSHPGTREPSPVREAKAVSPEAEIAPAPASAAEPQPEPKSPVAEEDVKDDWEASSDDEEKNAEGVKDSWDQDSDEEKAPAEAQKTPASNGSVKPAAKDSPKTVSAKTEPPKPHVPTTKAAGAPATALAKPAANGGKGKPKEESSSEEESSDESSDEETSSDEDSSDESEGGMTNAQRMAAQRRAEAAARRQKAHEEALAARSKDNLRSPICCILGHVDTGKTKLLDKIRQTNVQEGEAGGITQQIGATYFPVDAIKTKTAVMNKDGKQEYKIPGLLIIDTPGHESFTNLRSRGSSLCNIAILVVDIMHGLEPQTLESLRLLRDRKTPFIVALNKIDRIYGWEPIPDNDFRSSLAKQSRTVQRQFEDMVKKIIVAFAEQGLNACLYYENKNFARNVSIVPTSAVTGEGVPDMIMLLVNLTQQRMSDKLMYLSELECTVLEVKVIEGLGTTIDVVLSNGILHEGDKIVVCGLNGPIVTQIRALLTPQPLRELRIKSQYVHHKEVKAALGVKIVAPDLEKAIAGSRLLVVGPDDDEEDLMEEVMSDLTTLINSIDKSGRGVCVQASTLGSLEALLDFLKSSKIPVSGINIGPVHKKDVMRAATMLEKAKELACILCFDVPVDKEAEILAEQMGIRLFKADIIYHLFDAFTAYNKEIMEAKRKDAAPQAVWPCRLKIIAAFCKRDPIILGVDILDGTLRVGTPICVVKVDPETQKKEIIDLGRMQVHITSLEINHKSYDIVKKSQAGGGVAVKIEHAVYQSAKMFGRHFDEKDELYSHITRQSIDVLKASFKDQVTTEEWLLIKALKPRLGIQ
ncbi:hypothetical protein BN946_scf185043.g250 [Trametes cinnabarina]|uniref:Eukaryotic translation initiation factor 5B n=1 Tax=Pycnoporus cinnabarinus TaxID=5643 RepID=A0A060SP25_PYCCI|nr:hypothetical protein BN946_scf185043.g250 [Trametes cinnabarina]